jgi:hypothetical protein
MNAYECERQEKYRRSKEYLLGRLKEFSEE